MQSTFLLVKEGGGGTLLLLLFALESLLTDAKLTFVNGVLSGDGGSGTLDGSIVNKGKLSNSFSCC